MEKQIEEEKLKERTLLLMRYFWIDDIYRIGKELKLEYFNKFSNYWEINHYQGALEIAKAINDDDLLRLVSKNRPKYGLNLGGFHGKYYTATETGELKLEGSWNVIRKNVRKALEKWSDKAYGILQAIINRRGRATYFELIDEIEKVLGYEYIPSYILPRLGSLGLIYKTGSRRYPDWTMPSEIIPAVQEELSKFTRPLKPSPERFSPSKRTISLERKIGEIVEEIIDMRRKINLVFKKKFGTNLFRENEMAVISIRKTCSNEDEFNNRIASLALLIEVNEEKLKGLIKFKPKTGSINLLEAFLKDNFPDYNKKIIKNLRMIMMLRSKKFPIHKDDPKLLDALKYFGFTLHNLDWQDLWEKLLLSYLDSSKLLLTCLEKI